MTARVAVNYRQCPLAVKVIVQSAGLLSVCGSGLIV